MPNRKLNISITWIFRILWTISFLLLLVIKKFYFTWKLIYIGFIIFLTIISIFRIKESQREWYEEN